MTMSAGYQVRRVSGPPGILFAEYTDTAAFTCFETSPDLQRS